MVGGLCCPPSCPFQRGRLSAEVFEVRVIRALYEFREVVRVALEHEEPILLIETTSAPPLTFQRRVPLPRKVNMPVGPPRNTEATRSNCILRGVRESSDCPHAGLVVRFPVDGPRDDRCIGNTVDPGAKS